MQQAEDKYLKILNEHWGYNSFRGIQREIINSICAGRDTLGLMPTGGGKSITFQVPALSMQGVCIVITPLIALMKDQVSNLRQRGIKAAAIFSSMTHSEIIQTLENAIFGGVKILYVSPERLGSELFMKKFSHMNVSFITVDEAHCISQWGYDFRPSYLKIADIRAIKPNVPILALTATATPKVVDDIQTRLGFKEKNVYKMSFARKNLAYVVRHCTDKEEEVLHILRCVSGSAIIYVRNRKRTKETAKLLNDNGVSATFYNAGLEAGIRDARQKEWTEGKVRVMVATNAFGMGIDKPDVRLVIHIDSPDSIEAYFQEAGRAGRDGLKAYAVLLYNGNDKAKLLRRVNETYPDMKSIREIYEHLAYFYQIGMGSGAGCRFEFNIDRFCVAFKHFPTYVSSALKILTKAGYINFEEEEDSRAQVRMLLERDDLYRLDGLSATGNAVVISLLRNYSGLFSDYQYIDESLIAMDVGVAKPDIYDILKSLSERRILHFIPRKKIPHVTYTQRREEMERLVFPREAYDDRKKEYEERINSMISYATSDDICRSRQLLNYFGETKSTDCGQCDVCLSHKKSGTSNADFNTAQQLIKSMIADGKRHHVTEINGIDFNRTALEEALEYLASEEEVYLENGFISRDASVRHATTLNAKK